MTQQEMEAIWAEHIRHEFVTLDVEATLATMVEDASVNHVPVTTGGKGKVALRAFYRNVFIGSWPDDLQMTTTNRVFGQDQLVEEAHLRFTHKNRMDWLLPGVPATHRPVEVDFVIVVQFRDGKLSCERIYWDQATVLRQTGLVKECPRPRVRSQPRALLHHRGRSRILWQLMHASEANKVAARQRSGIAARGDVVPADLADPDDLRSRRPRPNPSAFLGRRP